MIALGATGFVAAGCWILYNTNVLNEYVPSTEAADRRASYERRYRQYQGLDLPRIISVRADVNIFPDRRSMEIRGTYRIRTRSVEPLRDIHVSIPERVHVNRLDLPAHDVILEDDQLGYGIYRLRKPLEPGEAIELGLDPKVGNRGFVNHGAEIALVDNGTFFTKRDFFPVVGYDDHRQLADPDERRRRGLEPVLRLPGVDNRSARRSTPRAPDALVAFSEGMGFNARLDGEGVIDLPFYVTAHEVAHQWWGQKMVGANVQGVGMLHETLAQYSALMVMENEFGRQEMRRVLEYELHWYLRGRAGERGVEPPLALVERQEYVYYHKGALAMYALRDVAGEAPLNTALSRYLSRVALQERPTARRPSSSRRAVGQCRGFGASGRGSLREDHDVPQQGRRRDVHRARRRHVSRALHLGDAQAAGRRRRRRAGDPDR